MKKKLALFLAIVMAGGIVFSTQFWGNKGNKSTVTDTKEEKKNVEFSVKYAFADVDMDQIIQEKDPKDDDPKADYIFVKFTSSLIRDKKDNNSANVKNFKLDSKELPKGTEMVMEENTKDMLIIKLPQGYLKGKNAGHVLEISKDLVNGENKVTGDLKLNLPYSKTVKPNDKDNNKKSDSSKAPSNDKNTQNKNSNGDNKNATTNKEGDKNKTDKGNNAVSLPKYTVEVGKGIPFSTTVLVKLQTPKVEDYKVTIDDVQLKIRENSKKEKVFIGTVKKDYSYDEVMSKLKIEKIKK